jgi:cell volume regulation protein A
MAVLLTVGTLQLFFEPNMTHWDFVRVFFLQITVGAVMGVLMGKLIPWTINKIKLEHLGLYPVLTICLVLMTYSSTEFLQGNGFLAVFITGLLMGNRKFKNKKYLIQFHDGTTWLMQIIIFLTLGLLVFPTQLGSVIWVDLLIAFFLMLIARPFSIFTTLALTNLNNREKLMISWAGLRGAVAIILATFPMVANTPNATLIFNIVFFVVLTSILIQGTTIPWIAKKLKLNDCD